MLIGLDFDDVVVDFIGPLLEFYNTKFGTDYKREQAVQYGVWNLWGCEREDAIDIVYDYYFSDVGRDAPLIKGALDGIRALYAEHDLVIITARNVDTEPLNRAYLKRHFPDLELGMHFNDWTKPDKVNSGKADICLELGVDVLVDDSYDYVVECLSAGVDALLFNYPWNENLELPDESKRVYSWDEIVDKIGGPSVSL